MFPIEQAESLSPCTVRWHAATPPVHEPVRLLLRAVSSFRSIPDRSNHPSMERSSISTTPAMLSRMTRDLLGLLPCSGSRIQPVLVHHRGRSRRHLHRSSRRTAPCVMANAMNTTRSFGRPTQTRRPRTPGTASLRSRLSPARASVQVETTMNGHSVADPGERRRASIHFDHRIFRLFGRLVVPCRSANRSSPARGAVP